MSGLTRHARTRVLVDENGTESVGVDAQISVTASVDASGYEMFHGWTPLSFWAVLSGCCSGRLLVAVALGLGLVAFGSVTDGVLPHGYLVDFIKLEQSVRRSWDRSLRMPSCCWKRTKRDCSIPTSAMQRLSTSSWSRPTPSQDDSARSGNRRTLKARRHGKDAESADRSRWISLLADLQRNTATPMVRLLREKPSQISTLGRRQTSRYFALKGTSCSEILELASAGPQSGFSVRTGDSSSSTCRSGCQNHVCVVLSS